MKDQLLAALKPIIDTVKGLDPAAADTRATLEARFPPTGPELTALRAMVRAGVQAGWLCEKENGGVRFGRVVKPEGHAVSVDAVHMGGTGAAHTHTRGEFNLCFAVSGAPTFDGRPEGWVVYGPQTWHVPTVQGGTMDILYFLPDGAMRFEAQPPTANAVGLQATTAA